MTISRTAYPVLLSPIVINASNKNVRVDENGTPATLAMVEGIYFARGDGSSDDIVEAFRVMLETHAGANSYTKSMRLLMSPSQVSAVISFEADTHNFSILFGNAATSFDATVLGFPQSDTAAGTSQESTKSPSSLWVSPNIYRSLEPFTSSQRALSRALSGKARVVSRRDEIRDRMWVQENVHEARFHEEANTSDPNAAFNRYLQRHRGGLRFEFNEALASDVTDLELDDTGDLEVVGTYVFSNDFYPARAQLGTRGNGIPLYNFQGQLLPYVA